MIPAEAVEAAAKAIQDGAIKALSNPSVDGVYDGMPYWEHIAQVALEAAAPYLCGNAKAEAWEEGYEQADSDAPHSIKSENPYRDQDATGAKIFASLPDGSVVGDMVKDGGNWYYIGSGRMVPPSKIQDAK